MPIALNNLSMILARKDKDTTEAISMAKKAVAVAPKVATIYDTLAFAEARTKDYSDAISSIQHAIDLEPENMLWRVHQARYYWESGKHKQAQNAAMQINAMQPGDNPDGKKAAKEWDELKAEMGKQASIN